jgi:tetratricopeptide (TPR) repeat protein
MMSTFPVRRSIVEHAMAAVKKASFFAGLLLMLAALFTPCQPLLADDEPVGRKLAFLVGIREYNHLEFKDLDFPENDVEELAEILNARNFRTVVLTTARGKKDASLKPTGENIRAQLKSLLADVTKRDLIIVGLAGHGIQPIESDESFFCPMDANPVIENGRVSEPQKLISLGELLGQLRKSGIGDKLVLIDACRNDPSVRGRRGVDHVNVSALPAQTGVLLSCSQGEFSFENKSLGKGHGAFFYHVIEGMNGAAKDQEGAVTWDSLRSYVKKQVPATVRRLYGQDGGEQNPNEIGNLGGAPPVLARIDRASIRPPTESQPPQSMPERTREKGEDLLNDPWIKKAERLSNIGDMEALGKLAGERLRGQPDSAIALMYQGKVLTNDYRYDDALDLLNKAIRLDKELAHAYDLRGDVYGEKSDYDLALRDYGEAIRLSPRTADYYVDRGWCYCLMSSWNSAMAEANQALQIEADNPYAYRLRAGAKNGAAGGANTMNEAGMSDAREAVRLYEKKIAADGEDRVAFRGLADAFAKVGEEQRAIETYNRIMRQGWATSDDYSNRAARYVGLDRQDWAIADCTKAIQLNPRNRTAYRNRGATYFALKRYDDAIHDATEVIRLDSHDAYSYNMRGAAYSLQNQFEQAKADYQQALRIDPNFAKARENLEKLK